MQPRGVLYNCAIMYEPYHTNKSGKFKEVDWVYLKLQHHSTVECIPLLLVLNLNEQTYM